MLERLTSPQVVSLAVFGVLALLTLGSAVLVVTLRRVTHAALALLPCFIGIAGLYGYLQAGFMLAMQILIYAGGILVLVLFAIFLLERRIEGPLVAASRHVPAGLAAAGLLAVLLVMLLQGESWQTRRLPPPPPELGMAGGPGPAGFASSWFGYAEDPQVQKQANTQRTGFYFLTYHLLPFELTSVVLLVAMVGAILLARKRSAEEEAPEADEAAPAAQPAEGGEGA